MIEILFIFGLVGVGAVAIFYAISWVIIQNEEPTNENESIIPSNNVKVVSEGGE
jgi:hypothetical protein